MKLNDWIERKTEELKTTHNYRQVIFKDVADCKISANCMQQIFSLCGDQAKVSLECEVEEINRKELTGEYISAVEVTFEVLKPRKRKLSQERHVLQLV